MAAGALRRRARDSVSRRSHRVVLDPRAAPPSSTSDSTLHPAVVARSRIASATSPAQPHRDVGLIGVVGTGGGLGGLGGTLGRWRFRRLLVDPIRCLERLALIEDEARRLGVVVDDLRNGPGGGRCARVGELLGELATERLDQGGDEHRALHGQVAAVALGRATCAIDGARRVVLAWLRRGSKSSSMASLAILSPALQAEH